MHPCSRRGLLNYRCLHAFDLAQSIAKDFVIGFYDFVLHANITGNARIVDGLPRHLRGYWQKFAKRLQLFNLVLGPNFFF